MAVARALLPRPAEPLPVRSDVRDAVIGPGCSIATYGTGGDQCGFDGVIEDTFHGLNSRTPAPGTPRDVSVEPLVDIQSGKLSSSDLPSRDGCISLPRHLGWLVWMLAPGHREILVLVNCQISGGIP